MKYFILVLLTICLMLSCGKPLPGDPGLDGRDGSPGAQGNPGVAGPTGQSNVRYVEFCPAQGPTAHDHFPEYGLCINGRLFGVYWDKGSLNAWLAEIVPGAYSSTATGLGCTFTVSADCAVSQ